MASFSSESQSVSLEIKRDIQIDKDDFGDKPDAYLRQISERLKNNKLKFDENMKEENTQDAYTGLYCLCKLAYGDLDQEIDSGIDQYLEFIKIQSETNQSFQDKEDTG